MKNVTDPEHKRKIIGGLFIEVFSKYIRKLEQKDFYLAQGTLYTDIIESRSYHGGKSVTIKSHHNVGGLPKDLKFDVIEPFRELFKAEVRRLGLFYKLDEKFINLHPFTGPIYDQAGELRVAEGEVADDFMMATMDWYVQGIDGELPQ